jgi:hypothetical protein
MQGNIQNKKMLLKSDLIQATCKEIIVGSELIKASCLEILNKVKAGFKSVLFSCNFPFIFIQKQIT